MLMLIIRGSVDTHSEKLHKSFFKMYMCGRNSQGLMLGVQDSSINPIGRSVLPGPSVGLKHRMSFVVEYC